METLTDITILLDRSGSMETIAEETIRSYNTFIKEQQSVKGNACLTLVQFDHEYNLVYEALNLAEVPVLNRSNYLPRGMTALLDAIGRTINITAERIEMRKEQSAARVILVIITDGHENHSRYYRREQVFSMISKMESEMKWEFVFLGASQDSIDEASDLGIKHSRMNVYEHNEEGIKRAIALMSSEVKKARENDKPVSFEENE